MITTSSKKWVAVTNRVVLVLLTIVVALEFTSTGVPKLLNAPDQVENFLHWGYPHWFLFIIGMLEAGGALLLFGSLLVKRLALPGVILIAVDMCGAIFTHITHAEWESLVLPIPLLVFVVIIGWMERKSWSGTHKP